MEAPKYAFDIEWDTAGPAARIIREGTVLGRLELHIQEGVELTREEFTRFLQELGCSVFLTFYNDAYSGTEVFFTLIRPATPAEIATAQDRLASAEHQLLNREDNDLEQAYQRDPASFLGFATQKRAQAHLR